LIDAIELSYRHFGKIFFKCYMCGECCFWGLNMGVFLTGHDLKRLPPQALTTSHTAPFDFVKGILGTQKVGNLYACIFQEKTPGRCKIYYQRPFECRLYPLIFDFTLDGRILLHLEHCPGVTFDGDGVDLINDLDKFFRMYFDKDDMDHLNFLAKRGLSPKPRRIPILPNRYGTWISREKILKSIITDTFLGLETLFDLPDRLLEKYNDWRKSITGNVISMCNRMSIVSTEGNNVVHILRGKIGSIKETPMVLEEAYKYLNLYALELVNRERTFGFVHVYDISLDDEICIYVNALRDILSIMRTSDHIDSRVVANALGLVDQYLEFYARKYIKE